MRLANIFLMLFGILQKESDKERKEVKDAEQKRALMNYENAVARELQPKIWYRIFH